ncbi:MAG: MGMT family protein [Verrucomicrobia bacterium]|nr:MGMT family protein [Verrucomicrobiota bacterium]
MIHRFEKGPPVSAQFFFEGGALSRIILASSPTFCCDIPEEGSQLLPWLKAYSEKKGTCAEIPWDTCLLTPFQKKVLQALQNVPFGEVVSYGKLAEIAGHNGASRAVGTACRLNPFPLLVPCHRVTAAKNLGGFAYGTALKQHLLDFERIYRNPTPELLR